MIATAVRLGVENATGIRLGRSVAGIEHGSSSSRQESKDEILSVADLTALPRFRAILFASGAPATMIETIPWMNGPHAQKVKDSLDTTEEVPDRRLRAVPPHNPWTTMLRPDASKPPRQATTPQTSLQLPTRFGPTGWVPVADVPVLGRPAPLMAEVLDNFRLLRAVEHILRRAGQEPTPTQHAQALLARLLQAAPPRAPSV